MHQIKSLHILCIVGLFLSQVVDAMQQCVINIPGQFVEFSTTDDVNVAANEITLIEDQSVYLRNGFEISSSLGYYLVTQLFKISQIILSHASKMLHLQGAIFLLTLLGELLNLRVIYKSFLRE